MLVATVFLCASAVKADIVQDGLIAYYSLDAATIDGDNVEDLVGDNDGVMAGGVKEVDGKFGGALEFDGSDGKLDIEGTDALMFNGIEEFTVSAWVFRNGPGGGVCCGPIIGQRDLAGWALRYDNRDGGAEAELIISPGWVGDGAGFGVAIPEGEWHHITGVLLDGTISMYLDGELEAEIAFPGTVLTSGGTATTLAGASDGYFDGVIDEALIYNKGLTEAENEQNFTSTRFSAVALGSKLATCWGAMKK